MNTACFPSLRSLTLNNIAVTLDDAANEGRFTHDPYIRRRRLKSVHCAPLFNKGAMIGILYLENNLIAGAFNRSRMEVLKSLCSQAAVSLENARLYKSLEDYSRGLEEIIAALDVAKEVQQNLLPQKPPAAEGLDLSGRSLYCDQTGGDYYDFFHPRDPGALAVVIGDVSGHGVSSALMMASVRAYLRALAAQSDSAAEVITAVNRLVSADMGETGQFMTLFYLVIHADALRMTWVRAGHEPTWVYTPREDRFTELGGPGLAIGLDEDWEYQESSGKARPGQIVIMPTDGVWEACNPAGEMFGKERFKTVIRENASLSADGLRRAIMEAVSSFQGDAPREDDITLIVMKVL